MYIYIISLGYKDKYSRRRLETLKRKLLEAHLLEGSDVKIIGIDGRNVKKQDYIDKFLNGAFKDGWLKDMHGSIGSALAHILCWKDIEKRGIEEDVLILEDDSDINKDFHKLMPKKMPEDYDVCYLHVYNQKAYDNGIYFDPKIKKCDKFEGLLEIHSYFINGRKIKHILDSLVPCPGPLDIEIGGNKKIIKYIIDPSLYISGQFTKDSIRVYFDDFYRTSKISINYPKGELEKISSNYTWKVDVSSSLLKGVSVLADCLNCKPNTYKAAMSRDTNGSRMKLDIYIYDQTFKKKIYLPFNWGHSEYKNGIEFEEIYFNIPNDLSISKNTIYDLNISYGPNEKSYFRDMKNIKPARISRKFIYI